MKSLYPTSLLKIVIVSCIALASFLHDTTAQCDGPTITLHGQSAVNSFRQVYGCSVIEGTLEIRGSVTNLDSLIELTRVGNLTISETTLPNLNGLQGLTKVDRFLNITQNYQLTTLQGLENLTEVGSLYVESNSILTDISGLSSLSRTISFVQNGYEYGSVQLASNDALSTLQGLNNLVNIDGDLVIHNMNFLLSLNGLNGLETVRKEVRIAENDMLQNLTGLHNLASAGNIHITKNESLFSLEGLNNLSELPEGIIVFLNPSLTRVGNLEKLTHVGKVFHISFSPLTSLEGLKLVSITGTEDPYEGGLNLIKLNLRDMKGLENLTQVEGLFFIKFIDSLKTLEGLENLRHVGHIGIEENPNLENIEAIANIESITGELEISSNPKLSFCSHKSICRYLEAPADLVLIYSNGPGCNLPEQVIASCSPVINYHIVDANLEIDGFDTTSGDIRLLPPAALLSLDDSTSAVATDGISTILLRLQTGTKGQITIPGAEENGFEFPWGDTAHLIDGYNYLFMLYTPPDEFDLDEEIYLYEDAVKAYDKEFDYTYTNGNTTRNNYFIVPHVLPPVVLMHGTYSDPDQAWKTAATEGISMYDRLVDEGFKVFTVNYKETNGTTGWITDNTSFADNAKVLWGDVYPQNTGGIKDALSFYRDSLNVAVTQADVVGHSLGGILPRVYASEHFNPDYKRAENFMEGDINRLITLASTHFGSHLGELQVFLNGLTVLDIGALDWLATQGYNLVSSWLGASASKAVEDQMPPPVGTALGEIGRTEIPAHALTLSVPKGALKDSIFDPDESYYDMYWYITTLLYQVNDVRNQYLDTKLAMAEGDLQAGTTITGGDPVELYPEYTEYMLYKGMIEDAIQYAGTITSILDGEFELPTDVEIYKYALGEAGMSDYADPLIDIFVAGADPVGVALDHFSPIQFPTVSSIIEDQLKVNEASMEGLRSLIFNNDANDGVVRVQSQSGELEKECPSCVSHYDGILHGFAPRYPDVQDRIVELLTSGMSFFNESGFPPVDHAQQIYFPPEELGLFQYPVHGSAAICQSGLQPSHARALANVADANNVIIIMRPVNPDATELIINQAATKAMNVKPKTSNWGPQKGYLPVKQRYSKLWKIFVGNERTKTIHEFDSLAQVDLNTGVTLARELTVSNCNTLFKVYIDENKIEGPGDENAEDEVVLIPLADPSKVCRWGEIYASSEIIEDCEPITDEHQLVPMLVMASPDQLEGDGTTARYLTADYDMLMVGFYEGPDQGAPDPPVLENRPVVGQATPEQEVLMAKINQAVQQTGYRGGKVVHHGPENQYDKSPYIDYPLTVFAPDNIPNGFFNNPTDGVILSIGMGRPGFRDEHLKRFVNRMRKEGYDLYHNPVGPGWKWTWDDDAEVYQLEDSKDLPDYVEQLPKNACDKIGGKEIAACPETPETDDASNDKPGTFVKSIADVTGDIIFKISPTIVYDQPVTFTIDASTQTFSWMIIDAFGNVSERGNIPYSQKRSEISVDVSNLGSGVYTIVTDTYGEAGRFVKF